MDNNNPDPWDAFRPPSSAATIETAAAVETAAPPDPAAATRPLFPYATHQPQPPQPPSPLPRNRRRWLGPVLGALGGAALLAIALWATGLLDGGETAGEVAEPREVVTDGSQSSATAVALKVVPSIVTVDIGVGTGSDFELVGSGSGVVLSSDGLIVTNHHVITQADVYQVVFGDGRIYRAEIVGSDRRTDLAVLRIAATDLTAIEIGSTETAEIGQVAIAIGSPLGLDGGPSVTVGVVSAFGRQVRTGSDEVDRLFDMLQTDAPITQGSSGGALVDGNGRLLGITSAIGISSAGAEGIGFAIPVELVTRITDEIIETGSVQHPFLGVSLDTAFAQNDDGSQSPAGAFVTQFAIATSAAAEAGMQVEDLIIAYDGHRVAIPDDLLSGLRRYRAGEEVTLLITRDSEQLEIPVILGVRPDDI